MYNHGTRKGAISRTFKKMGKELNTADEMVLAYLIRMINDKISSKDYDNDGTITTINLTLLLSDYDIDILQNLRHKIYGAKH